jgi:acetyl-CoA carboxylase biotin carboxyl carrier protein
MAQSAERQSVKSGPKSKLVGGTDRTARVDVANGTVQNLTDLDFLRGLIEAVDHSGIDTLEINRAGTRIRIAKSPPAAASAGHAFPAAAPAQTHHAAPLHAVPATAPAAAGAPDAAPAPAARTSLIDVKSPMVGTFYRAPAPDAPPYVEPGSPVAKGQTLCILEAMKLMNELESEHDGVVREILVEDADPVEFGQVLFRIEPAGSK